MADSTNLTNYLVCFRVEDKEEAYVASDRDVCSVCKNTVWRAYSNPDIDFTVICGVCALEMMKKADTVDIRGPTPEQLKDIRNKDETRRRDKTDA